VRILTKKTIPAMFGATIEYYDLALYGYLAPVLAPVFFPFFKTTTAYFFYFLIEFFSAIAQIAGAQVYGRIGDQVGRKKALFSSMLGTSVVTGCMSILPGYEQLGVFASFLFILARIGQSFFLGGEYNGGAIYCLEHESNSSQHGFLSGIYCGFTVAGVLLASAASTWVYSFGSSYFRIAYLVSFLLAVCTVRWRTSMRETPKRSLASVNSVESKLSPALMLVCVSVLVGLLHGIPSRVFNALLPIQTGVPQETLMIINTAFLGLYMMLLIFFGYLSDRFGVKKTMFVAAMAAMLFTYPLFLLLDTKDLGTILFVKGCYVIFAGAFIGPFHAFSQTMFSSGNRYRNISTCYAVGKCFSTLTISATFLLYATTNSIMPIAYLLIFSALMAISVLNPITKTVRQ
jgi:MHS family proline/betaine transporter-like MFS transporter